MTADKKLTEDVHSLFLQLTGVGKATKLNKILQSPFTLQPKLLELLEFEAQQAEAGKRAHVCIKVNSISDPTMIKALYSPLVGVLRSPHYVEFALCFRVSEHFGKHHSPLIVGRFLNTLVFIISMRVEKRNVFGWLMVRNLYRRVEALAQLRTIA